MTNDIADIYQRTLRIIMEQQHNIPVSALTDISSLNLDSLELFTLAQALEYEFCMEIPDHKMIEFVTINDIVEYIHKALHAPVNENQGA